MKTVLSRVTLRDNTVYFRVKAVKALHVYQARYWKALRRRGFDVVTLETCVMDPTPTPNVWRLASLAY